MASGGETEPDRRDLRGMGRDDATLELLTEAVAQYAHAVFLDIEVRNFHEECLNVRSLLVQTNADFARRSNEVSAAAARLLGMPSETRARPSRPKCVSIEEGRVPKLRRSAL